MRVGGGGHSPKRPRDDDGSSAPPAKKPKGMTPQQQQQALQEAQDARYGRVDPNPYGGLHGTVQGHSEQYRLESNHSPANSAYTGTPYANIPINQRPAHQLPYYIHRAPGGGIGSVSSTGTSDTATRWNQEQRQLLTQGRYHEAMMRDHNDIRNAAAPNRDYPVPSLVQSAHAARQQGLLTDDQYHQVLQNLYRS